MRLIASVLVIISLAPLSQAQFGDNWVRFTRNDGSMAMSPGDISNLNNEVDFSWGDLDQDGRIDMAVARKEPFSTLGRRTNVLLMNEDGILVDRTANFASASDFPGDQGFLTPTNDRDIVFADVDKDGWLDIVTCTALSFDDPKHIGHPRVYMNLGTSGGSFVGFEFQEARFPQLLHFTTGLPENPVFCAVAAGDVTDDGFTDLYFSDYDMSNEGVFPGGFQDPLEDLNDRLLINDGTGFFTDQSQLRMSEQMLLSAFGADCKIVDVNGDGYNDVMKETSLGTPYYAAACYNDPDNPGMMTIFDAFHTLAPYHMAYGDLNNDGRIDGVFADDDPDRYRYNLGNDPLGRVIWGPAKTYQFLAGGDDGFGGNNLIVDLDHDGWNDVLQCDIDPDDSSYSRRLHIYHNPGGEVGSQITLREERQTPGSGGWLGAVGFKQADLKAAHDVAFFDLDEDGDNDIVLGRSVGTFVWLNQVVANLVTTDVGKISLSAGGAQQLNLNVGGAFGGDLYLMLGSLSGTSPGIPFSGFTIPLNPDPYFFHTVNHPNLGPLTTSFGTLNPEGSGMAQLSLPPGTDASLAGATVHHAFGVLDPVSFDLQAMSESVPVLLFP